jgi:2-C-methyl-D-erythritol 2,4-cyclodiphosphate synthase
MLIGQGIDAHRFETGRRWCSAASRSPTTRGLPPIPTATWSSTPCAMRCSAPPGSATSAITFPDDDAAYAGIDSRILLRRVMAALAERGLAVHNADLTIAAQAPKLAPHIAAMRETLAADLRCPAARVNVKATTTERMGFTGRGEGIAAFAVVLLDES